MRRTINKDAKFVASFFFVMLLEPYKNYKLTDKVEKLAKLQGQCIEQKKSL